MRAPGSIPAGRRPLYRTSGRSPAVSISGVRTPSLRGHGLSPQSLVARARRRLQPREVSRERLLEYRRGLALRPPAPLPSEPPRTLALVVPCYGHAAYLPAAIESVLAQTRLPDEIVFIDDCSPDATGRILAALESSPPPAASGRLRILANDRNIGQSESLNRAIAATATDAVMVLNDDDYLMHDAVERMLALFRDYPGVALIGANHVRIAGSQALSDAAKLADAYPGVGDPLKVSTPRVAARFRLAGDLPMTHSGMCFLRPAWSGVGGYLADAAERLVPSSDRDFQMRINLAWPVGVARRACLSFWRSDSSVDAGRFT